MLKNLITTNRKIAAMMGIVALSVIMLSGCHHLRQYETLLRGGPADANAQGGASIESGPNLYSPDHYETTITEHLKGVSTMPAEGSHSHHHEGSHNSHDTDSSH